MSAPAAPPPPPATPPAPAPRPAAPPAAPPAPPPPPPPAAKKPQTRKSDFERDTDAFNVVTDRSWLTHQNVMRLMRETFLKKGRSEEEVDAMFLETCAITDDAAGDQDLLITILKFIGQDPPQLKASIALCHGGHRHPVTGEISGGAHWTALDLRMVETYDGSHFVDIVSLDSIGDVIPPAVATVVQTINRAPIEYIRARLSPDLQENATFIRALTELERSVKVRVYPGQCDRQADGHSCGYHAVFNLARMHDAPPFLPALQQDGRQVGPAEFITARRRDLKAIFAGPVLRERVVASTDPAKVAADQTAMTPSEKEAAKIYKIIFADDMTGDGRHVVKLKKLMEAEQQLLAGGEKNVFLLSELQLEKHYERIICEWVEELKDKVRSADDAVDVRDQIQFLDDLKTPEAWQNPKAVFEVLSAVSSGIAGDKDFLQTGGKVAELQDQWQKAKDDGAVEETWASYSEKLKKLLQQEDLNLPESLRCYEEVEGTLSSNPSWQDCKKAFQKIHATIQTEKTKQKVFGELEFFDEAATASDDWREISCDGIKYGLQLSEEGVIEIFTKAPDGVAGATATMNPIPVEEQNHILSKLEKEIRTREKMHATVHPSQNFVKSGNKIIQATDGSIKFKSTRTVALSAEDPYQKFAKDDARNWQKTKELGHGKVEMVKWDKLEKDDERWELKGNKVELKPIASGEEKAGKKAGAKVAITTLDRDLMSYYLHGKSGAAVEAQKKKYGIEKTVEKISDLEKPETVIKLISVRAMKERGSTSRSA